MSVIGTNSGSRLTLLSLGAVLVGLAFLRGRHLLGFEYGLIYALVTAGFARLLMECVRPDGGLAIRRLLLTLVPAVLIGFAMAFPAAINSDYAVFIEKQAIDRAVRREIKTVIQSDAAFAELSVSTVHLKVVNVTVSGEVLTRADLNSLRTRLLSECPTLTRCPLHWDVRVGETTERLDGLDRDVFAPKDQSSGTTGFASATDGDSVNP